MATPGLITQPIYSDGYITYSVLENYLRQTWANVTTSIAVS
jgi:hypothetical protein